MNRTLQSWLGLATLGALVSLPATGGTVLSDSMQAFHVELANREAAGKATGVVLLDNGGLGSGAVINPGDFNGDGAVTNEWAGSQWFITAAHVVVDIDGMFVGTGSALSDMVGYRATNWFVPDTYDGSVVSGSDIALIRVDRPFDASIPRLELYSGGAEPGNEVVMSGFGTSGTGATGQVLPAGIKRTGYNRYDGFYDSDESILTFDYDIDPDDELYSQGYESYYQEINGLDSDTVGLSARENVWDFRIPYEYSSAQGDSGGPITIGSEIYGLTSFGPSPLFTSVAGDLRVSPWRDWVYSVITQFEGTGNAGGTAKAGVLIGSEGDGIDIAAAGGASVGSNIFIHKAQLLQDYFRYNFDDRTDNDLSLVDSLDLLNITPDTYSLADVAVSLGLADTATDVQVYEALQLALSSKIDPSLAKLAETDPGEYGYFRGVSMVGTSTGLEWDPSHEGPITLEDYIDFFDGLLDPSLIPQILYGDMNLDGTLDLNDVHGFVMALLDEEEYIAMIGVTPDMTGDMNGDDLFGFSDINGFADALNIDPQALYALIPEPGTGALLMIATLAMLRRRRLA